MTDESTRELEIKMMVPLQRWQWMLLMLYLAVACALMWVAYFGLTNEPLYSATQLIVVVVIAAQALLRIRYLKALFLRINRAGCSWRLIDGFEKLQQTHPPISEHDIRWDALSGVRHEATGMRCFLRDGSAVFLPMSNFSYAQRQDIKRVMALHLSEQKIAAQPFTPVGWQDEPAPAAKGATEQ